MSETAGHQNGSIASIAVWQPISCSGAVSGVQKCLHGLHDYSKPCPWIFGHFSNLFTSTLHCHIVASPARARGVICTCSST